MTPEQQRIKIAEACGITEEIHNVVGKGLVYAVKNESGLIERMVPDYLNDLNAIHEAEKVLCDAINGQCKKYYENLFYTLMRDGGEPSRFGMLHATASQRAESFLKTIGKWQTTDETTTEDKPATPNNSSSRSSL